MTLKIIVNGETKTAHTLKQAVYMFDNMVRPLTSKVGTIIFSNGSQIIYNGTDWIATT